MNKLSSKWSSIELKINLPLKLFFKVDLASFSFIFGIFQTDITIFRSLWIQHSNVLKQVIMKNLLSVYGIGIRSHNHHNLSLFPLPLDHGSHHTQAIFTFRECFDCRRHKRSFSKVNYFVFWISKLWAVWPDWTIYWTLGSFLEPNLPIPPTFWGNFCKGVKIFKFSSEIIFGQL